MFATTTGRLGKLGRAGVIAGAVAAAAVTAAAAPTSASAYVGETRSIPSYHGASGSAKLTAFRTYGTAKATVTLRRGSNSYCVYVQAAPYLSLGADGGWKQVPDSRTCSTSTSYYTDSMFLGYDGIKFRICQDIPYAADTCGSVAYIRGS